MTASTVARPSDLGPGRVRMVGVMHSEWIKLRTLRSTWYSLLALALFVDVLGVVFAALHAHRSGESAGPGPKIFDLDPTQVSLRGVFLAQLAVAVLGVLVITGEYSTGMIRSSLSAVPRRLPVLFAKMLVFATVVFVVCAITDLIAFLLGQQAQASTHAQASLSTPGALRAIFGAAVFLTLIGILAVGLGFLLRSTAGALTGVIGILLVAPLLAEALPSPYSTDVLKYLPLSAGRAIITTVGSEPDLLGPWAGIGVTALYSLAAMIAGGVALVRRDA